MEKKEKDEKAEKEKDEVIRRNNKTLAKLHEIIRPSQNYMKA